MKKQIFAIGLMMASIQASTVLACVVSPQQYAELAASRKQEETFSVPNTTYSSSKISITTNSISFDETTLVYDKNQKCWGIASQEKELKIYTPPSCILDKKVFNRHPVTGERNAQLFVDDVAKKIVIYPTNANGEKIHGERISTFELNTSESEQESGVFSVNKNGELVGLASIRRSDMQPKCGPNIYDIDSYQEVFPDSWLRSGGKMILPSKGAE